MDGLSPVQISELVTLLDDELSTCNARLDQAPLGGEGVDRAGIYNEIDHLEAELAWIQWMRENHLEHEEIGFPAAAVEEHVQGMRAGIRRWRKKMGKIDASIDGNYIHSLENSITIVGRILKLFAQVRKLG